MSSRPQTRRTRTGTVMGLATAILALTAIMLVPAASAAPMTVVYNNTTNPLPGNVPSVGFQATQTSEFGGQVQFAGTERDNPRINVRLSSWGCQSGTWNGGNCSTTPGSEFAHEIRLNVYKVNNDDEPGRLRAAVTRTVDMPYRPSANYTHCTDANAGKWYHSPSGNCYNGKLFNLTFDMGDTTLPEKAIISVEYNTSSWGYEPIGTSPACFTSSGGCPYDSLNVGTEPGPPSVGTMPLPDDAYLNSATGGQYCDGGAGGTGFFRLDAGCWTGFQPAIKVSARA